MAKSMEATALSYANIAFIKYWGNLYPRLRVPSTGSISMNLSQCITMTDVRFDESMASDALYLNGELILGEATDRVSSFLDIVRKKASVDYKAVVRSKNYFPLGCGLASSASAYSALAVAASNALGLKLDERRLSILARRGSGSACRSIPGGFSEWRRGTESSNSYAVQIAGPKHFDIVDIIALVDETHKLVSSSEGHSLARTSPEYIPRLNATDDELTVARRAILERDFSALGKATERDAWRLHKITTTSEPPINYWLPKTEEVVAEVARWRQEGLEAYFTTDAGPNVHILTLPENAEEVITNLAKLGINRTIVNKPAGKPELL